MTRNIINHKVLELEKFLYTEYPRRLNHINRCIYLGIKPDEKRIDLEKLAYEKEQELRTLVGKPLLEEINTKNII